MPFGGDPNSECKYLEGRTIFGEKQRLYFFYSLQQELANEIQPGRKEKQTEAWIYLFQFLHCKLESQTLNRKEKNQSLNNNIQKASYMNIITHVIPFLNKSVILAIILVVLKHPAITAFDLRHFESELTLRHETVSLYFAPGPLFIIKH